MGLPPQTAKLPTFAALEALPVLEGVRPGASIQISSQYFDNRISALTALDDEVFAERIDELRQSRTILGDATVSVNSLTVESLLEAGSELRETFLGMPEATQLRASFPGDSVVVPELLRTTDRIRFGMRIYFFPSDDAPDASDVVRQNVESVVAGERSAFERYKGQLHGYPECCIDHFVERNPDGDSPEVQSVRPLESHVHVDRIGTDRNASITEITSEILDEEHAYAFFSRKFYPHHECETARERGRRIFETLDDALDERLVRDYFRLNYVLAYIVAQNTIAHEKRELPAVGTLGTEHVYFYLPLRGARMTSRYS